MAAVSPLSVIATFLLIGALNFSDAQVCDFFDPRTEACIISLPTSRACGVVTLTQQQTFDITTVDQRIIDDIEAIGGPIYEGTAEAAALGISVAAPIVPLTPQQEAFYRRCEVATLLIPDNNQDQAQQDQAPVGRRRKRQIVDNTCCSPSPSVIRILASVTSSGNAVQVIQPPGLAQFFQDIRFCPGSAQCGNIQCGPVETVIPAEVILLNPPRIGRENIVINICGATTL